MAFKLSQEIFIIIENKKQTESIKLEFSIVRNSKPYPKLAKATCILKDFANKDIKIQLIMANYETMQLFLKIINENSITIIAVAY